MYTLKNKIKILLGSVLLFTSLFAASPTIQNNALTDKQLHAVMGIITNFILSDVPQHMTIISPTNVTVEENQTSAIDIRIKDAIGAVSYSISGTDATYFNIDASTGHIAFINAPDSEIKQHYTFIVTVTDSGGNTATATITVNIQNANNISIEELKELLNDPSVPYTTDADFNKTEYAKHHLADDEAKKLERAHMLVATAKDPDPEWFYTDVDKSVIVTDAGAEHTITLKKMRKDGTVYAPVDNDKLRLVVRIQKSKDEFEYITNVNIDQYAHWDGAGILKINVPQDLDKGRMIVGVRPNFDDVATAAIAERWSTVIVAEVWHTKQGVISPSIDNVLFPIDDATKKGLSSESKFSLETIGARLKVHFEDVNSTLFFPMVVKDMNLKKDDLVSYTFQGTPYAGKVIEITTIDNQDFVLLAPTLFDVYDITDAEDGFMIKEGLYPENVIIREGDRLVTDKNESDSTEFKGKMLKAKKLEDVMNYFNQHCKDGKGALTIKTTFSIVPFDVGIDVGLLGLNKETKCTWEADASKLTLNPAYFAVGGPAAVVMSALGLHGTMEPYGKLELVAKDALGMGLEAGYSYQKGAQFNLLSPSSILGSRNLGDEAQVATGEIGSEFGLKYTVAALDPEKGLGWVLSFLPGMSVTNIGAEGTSGIKAGLAMSGKNASEVKKSGSSELAISISSEIGLKLTESLSNWLIYLDVVESTHEIKSSINLVPPIKVKSDFTYASVIDNGQGSAEIYDIQLLGHPLLNTFLSDPKLGVLSINNTSSSVYNDKSEAITYSLDECAKNEDKKITSTAIACAGWMCGVVNKEVVLCKDTINCKDPSIFEVLSQENENTAEWRVVVKNIETNETTGNVYPFNLNGSLYQSHGGDWVLASCGGTKILSQWNEQKENQFYKLEGTNPIEYITKKIVYLRVSRPTLDIKSIRLYMTDGLKSILVYPKGSSDEKFSFTDGPIGTPSNTYDRYLDSKWVGTEYEGIFSDMVLAVMPFYGSIEGFWCDNGHGGNCKRNDNFSTSYRLLNSDDSDYLSKVYKENF